MSEKRITIELFKVDNTGEYLNCIFRCPNEYFFNTVHITAYMLSTDGTFSEKTWDLSTALDLSLLYDKKRFAIRVPLSSLDGLISNNAIFKLYLKAELDVRLDEEPWYNDLKPDIDEFGFCSNVLGVYRCLLQDVLKNGSCDYCSAVSDDVIRNYLILYGHTSAMLQDHIDESMEYYKILSNCFVKCEGDLTCNKDCGCSKTVSSCNCN